MIDQSTRPSPAQPQARRRSAESGPTIHTPAQVRALIAPARQEIVDVLDAAGPCAVATLAALVGRPADALYHHLRRLVRVGLVIEIERRKEGRHAFAVYDLAFRPLRIRYEGPVRKADVARVVGAATRQSWREFRRGLRSAAAVTQGSGRTLWGARAKGWVTPDRLKTINALLAELLETVRGGGPADDAIPISVSFLLAPSPPSRSGTGRPKSTQARRRRAAAASKGNLP